MSEYQYYEFLALDQPLTKEQRAELPTSLRHPLVQRRRPRVRLARPMLTAEGVRV